MNYKEIRNFLVALVVFLVIVLTFRLIADLMGETSPTGPIKIFFLDCWFTGCPGSMGNDIQIEPELLVIGIK
nr:hypothetical protein [Methanobacterium formicicum]